MERFTSNLDPSDRFIWWGTIVACALAMVLIYGCRSDGDEVTAQRLQCLERVQWQWVPPFSKAVNGQVHTIPGHWHNRFAPCGVCGDRTARPGTVADANPHLAPQPAPLTPVNTTPAAPPTPAANPQPHDDVRFARLGAELAGVRSELERIGSYGGRIEQLERALPLVGDEIDELHGKIQQLGAGQVDLRAAVERLGPRIVGIEKTTAADRASLGERVRDAVGRAAGAATDDGGKAAALVALAEGFGVGGPLGVGVVLGGMLLARAVRRRRRERSGDAEVSDAGGQEAPADDPFRDAEPTAEAEAFTAGGGGGREPAAAATDGDRANLRAL